MKPHVLVVDDSLTVRMDLRAVLHELGFTVTACDTKASAQKALRSRTYALVILDVLLPDGSGIEILKDIRGNAEWAHTPVIMLSTEAEVKHRIRGLTMGADQYVAKPYDSAYVGRCARMLAAGPVSGPAASSPSDSLTGKKVLIVDDSPTYLEALADVLRQDGHEVVPATSGEEALELLAVELVDAIILDLLMPGIGGLETCRRIRDNSAQQHIPIMMLTGRDDREARSQGLSAGVDEFVLKSPELEPLKLRLRALLRKKRGDHQHDGREERVSNVPSSGMWGRQADVPRTSLLFRVVTESGLSNVIGPTTIMRACKRVGVDARTMSTSDLKRALPTIRETLRLFLPPEETEHRMMAIAALVKDVM